MATDPVPIAKEMLVDALAFMESALALLDRAGAPAQIGAHLDLAICELAGAIGSDAETMVPSGEAAA